MIQASRFVTKNLFSNYNPLSTYLTPPLIEGNRVLWTLTTGYPSSTLAYLYDTTRAEVTSSVVNGGIYGQIRVPDIYQLLYQNSNVAWTAPTPIVLDGYELSADNVYFRGDGVISRLTNNNNPYLRISPADTSGSNVTWSETLTDYDYGYSYSAIYLFNGESTNRIATISTPYTYAAPEPRVSRNRVVWAAWDGNDHEIYLYSNGRVTQITNNLTNEGNVDISGNNIVWDSWDGNDSEIYFYDGSSTIQLTNNTIEDQAPVISGTNIAWQSAWSGGSGINLATFGFNIEEEFAVKLGSQERKVKFNLVQPTSASNPSIQQSWNGKTVWIISHGWNSGPGRFTALADAIKLQRSGDVVMTLDWSQAAGTGLDYYNGNFDAAKWIGAIADQAADKLTTWGISNGSSINLVGHSLGSLLSSELASRFGRVQTLTALEPPSELNPGQYDLDGRNSTADRPRAFNAVSNFSRAFVGKESLAGNSDFAATADESIVVDFNKPLAQPPSLDAEHGRVIDVFTNLIRPGSQGLANNLFTLSDYQVRNPQIFRQNAFSRSRKVEPLNLRQIYEGEIEVTGSSDRPVQFTAKNAQTAGADDDLIYGTNGNDDGTNGSLVLQAGAGRDILTGGLGADRFVLATGSALTAGVDTITDFVRNTDRIVLNKAALRLASAVGSSFNVAGEFASVTSDAAAATSNALITYNRSNGRLFYNQNGAAAGFGTGAQLAALTGNPALATSDFIIQ